MLHKPPKPTPQTSSRRLNGSIERVIFYDGEGYWLLRVKVQEHRDLVTVVGSAPTVTVGEVIEALGGWVNDRQYGRQFKADRLITSPPTTLEGIEKYLGSGLVDGIGPHFAKQLVEAFGEAVIEVIENTPERLEELEGIGSKRRLQITAAWAEQKVIREIMVFLHFHGVSTSRALRIYETYGDQAIYKIKENPYRLARDIKGIGFKTADQIAEYLGIPKDAPIRIQAGMLCILEGHSQDGHCGISLNDLKSKASGLLGVFSNSLLTAAINEELSAKNLMCYGGIIYLAPLYWAERGCATQMLRLLKGEPPWGQIDIAQTLPWVEGQTGLSLSASQREAIATVLRHKVSIITGGPGVGKTTLLTSLLRILQASQVDVLLCAPTGRAAKRLTETTGLEAKTVHRLLEFNPAESKFKRNANNPLATQVLVLDEASMMDIELMNQLLSALPDHAGLIIVGDADQLPSVGPGSVLADLIGSEVVPTVGLKEIFRQTEGSRIILNAHRINQGEPIIPHSGETSDFYLYEADTDEFIAKTLMLAVTERIPAKFGFDPIDDIQVLTPMNSDTLGVRALNRELQQRLNAQNEPKVHHGDTDYAIGDKVIQRANNYEKDVFNGDIGRVSAVDLEASQINVQFGGREVLYEFAELDQLSLAYAISIHKSQGSEYPVVVIPLAMRHSRMLQKNLLYTAVTRGKQLVVLIANTKALNKALKNCTSQQRTTRLDERLRASSVAEASQDEEMESLLDSSPTPFWLFP